MRVLSQYLKKIFKKTKFSFLFVVWLFFYIFLIFVKDEFTDELFNIDFWRNMYIAFVANNVTIISVFFGLFIPMLTENTRNKVPENYLLKTRKNLFNWKIFAIIFAITFFKSIQIVLLIFNKSSFYSSVYLTATTLVYYILLLFYGIRIIYSFDYSKSFLRNINSISKMIERDVLKEKISENHLNKYIDLFDSILKSFPEKKEHFEKLGERQTEISVSIYLFINLIFSKGLFLYERFDLFKIKKDLLDIKYLKSETLQFQKSLNFFEEVLLNKAAKFFEFLSHSQIEIFCSQINEKLLVKNISNISFISILALTRLHFKLLNIKNQNFEFLWINVLIKFARSHLNIVKRTEKIDSQNLTNINVKSFIQERIFVNHMLFNRYLLLKNDQIIIGKISFFSFNYLHTYITTQVLFAFEKLFSSKKSELRIILHKAFIDKNKFLWNSYIENLSEILQELLEFVKNNEIMKKNNKTFFSEEFMNDLKKYKRQIYKGDINNINLTDYYAIEDFNLDQASQEIFNSIELQKNGSLKILVDKIIIYVKGKFEELEIQRKIHNEIYLDYLVCTQDMKELLYELLRLQMIVYELNSKEFIEAMDNVLYLNKYNFFRGLNIFKSNWKKIISEKFDISKKNNEDDLFSNFVNKEWFEIEGFRNCNEIVEEKNKWEEKITNQ